MAVESARNAATSVDYSSVCSVSTRNCRASGVCGFPNTYHPPSCFRGRPMPSSILRRRFLRVSVGGAVASLGGCLESIRSSGSRRTTGTPTYRTPPPPDEPRTDDIYVNNEDGEEYRVSIRLVRVDGDAEVTVLDYGYRLPDFVRFRIPDVGDQGATYEVVVGVDGDRRFTGTWDVRTCEGTEAPRGNRDAEVRIEDGEIDVVTNACDAIWVEPRPASDHTGFLVERTETGTKMRTATTDG